MDAASEWPVRRIRRHGGKLPPIISVVKIKILGKSWAAYQSGQFSLLCSKDRAFQK
jgi:hypothetical protein